MWVPTYQKINLRNCSYTFSISFLSPRPVLCNRCVHSCMHRVYYSGHIPSFGNIIISSLTSSVCTKRVVFPAGATPLQQLWIGPLCLHSLHWVPRCRAFKSCSISSSFYSQAAGDHLPSCPTEEPSTPTWSPWPASLWRRAGRQRAQESWQRCSTRCALRWKPSPALCVKLGSPTCE